MNNNQMSPSDIINKHSQSAPVNLAAIANDLGLTIFQKDFGSQVSGMIKKDAKDGGSSGYAIYVNRQDNGRRQRFTIAHELAHFMLHRELIGDGIQEDAMYRGGFSNEIERQANRLAADILMPFHLVNQLKAAHGSNVEEMARSLQVSLEALKIRLSIQSQNYG